VKPRINLNVISVVGERAVGLYGAKTNSGFPVKEHAKIMLWWYNCALHFWCTVCL